MPKKSNGAKATVDLTKVVFQCRICRTWFDATKVPCYMIQEIKDVPSINDMVVADELIVTRRAIPLCPDCFKHYFA